MRNEPEITEPVFYLFFNIISLSLSLSFLKSISPQSSSFQTVRAANRERNGINEGRPNEEEFDQVSFFLENKNSTSIESFDLRRPAGK